MTDEEFYLRLGDIWNDLNTFWQKLTIPTHSQKSITDLGENLLRIKINRLINDWLIVAYIPDSKDVESPRLRSPSGDNEKQIYDYLNEALHILVHWWKHKKELEQWSNTARKLKPICNELKKICAEANRQPIQTIGMIADLRKVADLLKEVGLGHYTIRHVENIGWELNELWENISCDTIYYGKGISKSAKKETLSAEKSDMKALVEDVVTILDNVENMTSDEADRSAKKILYLADELERISTGKPESKNQAKDGQVNMDMNNTSLNIELKDLIEKIQRYLSGEKETLEIKEWNYLPQPKTAYINARNLALKIKQKYSGLKRLPLPYESNPNIGLQDLLEWCIDNIDRNKKVGDKEQVMPTIGIVTENIERKIEQIDDFCNWTNKLIDYIKHPNERGDASRTRAHTLGDQVNNLAQKIWPQINFDKTGWPYESSGISEFTDLQEGSIFSIEPELKARIIDRLQQWKERALKDKSKLQEEMEIQSRQVTGQVGLQEKEGQRDFFKFSINELIKEGEGHNLEFKETLEYDVRGNQKNRNLNKECLKSIAAFLNTDGGTLLIGVRDNGEVVGIEQDLQYVQRKNTDGFELKLRSLIKSCFDPTPLGKVKMNFIKHAKGTVCRINISSVNINQVIHLDKEVYIRDGNMTIKLDGRKLTDWIQQRSQAGNTTSENENKQTSNGWGLRPVFPQDKIECHKPEMIGYNEEELLTALYYDYTKWLEDTKRVCKSKGIPLDQHLKKGLELAVKDKRVPDSSNEIAVRLLRGQRTGQDILLFFVKKCRHVWNALLNGELPPYPWRNK